MKIQLSPFPKQETTGTFLFFFFFSVGMVCLGYIWERKGEKGKESYLIQRFRGGGEQDEDYFERVSGGLEKIKFCFG